MSDPTIHEPTGHEILYSHGRSRHIAFVSGGDVRSHLRSVCGEVFERAAHYEERLRRFAHPEVAERDITRHRERPMCKRCEGGVTR